MSTNDEPHALYRFYDSDNCLIYVGITKRVRMRFKQHHDGAPWWDEAALIRIERYPSRAEAITAERNAVQGEHPVFNSVHADLHRIKSDDTIPRVARKEIESELVRLARERAQAARDGVQLPRQRTWEELLEPHCPDRKRFR